MNQEKFGKLIKNLRKKNNLTQKELAQKYNVTYQAVSKWENGKNMPDISLIKQISKDFNISLDELFDSNVKNKSYKLIVGIIIIIMLILIFVFLLLRKEADFSFKTLTSTCDNFNISGSISYNDKKSAIYISSVKYCGGDDLNKYRELDCTLYESFNDVEKKISSYKYNESKAITLDKFLEDVNFVVNDYKKECKNHKENSLYLLINAVDTNNNIVTYKVPLELVDTCSE